MTAVRRQPAIRPSPVHAVYGVLKSGILADRRCLRRLDSERTSSTVSCGIKLSLNYAGYGYGFRQPGWTWFKLTDISSRLYGIAIPFPTFSFLAFGPHLCVLGFLSSAAWIPCFYFTFFSLADGYCRYRSRLLRSGWSSFVAARFTRVPRTVPVPDCGFPRCLLRVVFRSSSFGWTFTPRHTSRSLHHAYCRANRTPLSSSSGSVLPRGTALRQIFTFAITRTRLQSRVHNFILKTEPRIMFYLLAVRGVPGASLFTASWFRFPAISFPTYTSSWFAYAGFGKAGIGMSGAWFANKRSPVVSSRREGWVLLWRRFRRFAVGMGQTRRKVLVALSRDAWCVVCVDSSLICWCADERAAAEMESTPALPISLAFLLPPPFHSRAGLSRSSFPRTTVLSFSAGNGM